MLVRPLASSGVMSRNDMVLNIEENAMTNLDFSDYLKIALNVIVAGATGFAAGGYVGAITAIAAVLGGLFQHKPGV